MLVRSRKYIDRARLKPYNTSSKYNFHPLVSEGSREVANLNERKNPHAPLNGVKEFVHLSCSELVVLGIFDHIYTTIILLDISPKIVVTNCHIQVLVLKTIDEINTFTFTFTSTFGFLFIRTSGFGLLYQFKGG